MLSLFALTSSNSPFFLLIPDAVAWTHQLLQWLLLFSCAAAAAKSLSCPTLCDPMRPHRWQPTRLLCPWDFPGKNTGVGCHFLQCIKVKSESEAAQLCPTLSDPMDCSLPGSSVHAIFQARVLEWVAIAFSDALCRALQISLPLSPLTFVLFCV